MEPSCVSTESTFSFLFDVSSALFPSKLWIALIHLVSVQFESSTGYYLPIKIMHSLKILWNKIIYQNSKCGFSRFHCLLLFMAILSEVNIMAMWCEIWKFWWRWALTKQCQIGTWIVIQNMPWLTEKLTFFTL